MIEKPLIPGLVEELKTAAVREHRNQLLSSAGFDPETHLNDLTSYEAFEWATGMSVKAGDVLHISHTERPDLYIFECTDIRGGKLVEGFLSQFKLEGGTVELGEVAKAKLNLLHPSAYLAQANTPFLEFITEDDSRVTRFSPIYSEVKRAYSAMLAQTVYDRAAYLERIEPFQSSEARLIVGAVAAYLVRAAEKTGTQDYRSAAELLAREILRRQP